jgi:hypothetical protein
MRRFQRPFHILLLLVEVAEEKVVKVVVEVVLVDFVPILHFLLTQIQFILLLLALVVLVQPLPIHQQTVLLAPIHLLVQYQVRVEEMEPEEPEEVHLQEDVAALVVVDPLVFQRRVVPVMLAVTLLLKEITEEMPPVEILMLVVAVVALAL